MTDRSPGFTLRRKLALLVAATVLVGVTTTGIIYHERYVDLLEVAARERLLSITATAALNLDLDGISEITDVTSPAFRRLRQQLRAVRAANGLGHEHLYVLRREADGHFVYVAMPHDDDRSFVGRTFPDADGPALVLLRRAYQTGEAGASEVFQDERGGWISAFAPLREPGGRTVGVLEADADVNSMLAAQSASRWGLLRDAALGVILAMLLGTFFARQLIAPIHMMAARMKTIAEGDADLTQQMPVTTSDELRLLVDSFNRFVTTLRDIIANVHRVTRHAQRSAASGSAAASSVLEGSQRQVQRIGDARAVASSLQSATFRIAQATNSVDASGQEATRTIATMQASVNKASLTIGEMNDAITSAANSLGGLSSAIQTIDDNVARVAQVSEEVATSVVALDASIRDVGSITAATAATAHETRKASEVGRVAVQETSRGLDAIEARSRQVTEAILTLERRSREIGSVLTVIREVAEQTHLLALNAAIIAALAGEQGKGFKVVADEIHGLAQRAREATREIAALVAAVQKEAGDSVAVATLQAESVADGRKLAAKALRGFQSISAGAEETSSRMSAVAQAVAEQVRSVSTVSDGTRRIGEMLEGITRATREQSSAGGQLQSTAERARQVAERSTQAFGEQAARIREAVRAIEGMAESIGSINRQTLTQASDVRRLTAGMDEVFELAQAFAGRAGALLEEMAAIEEDVAAMTSLVGRFKVVARAGRGGREFRTSVDLPAVIAPLRNKRGAE